MKSVNRSKRSVQEPPKEALFVLKALHLLEALVRRFLLLNVVPDPLLVSAHRRDKIASRPAVLSDKLAPFAATGPRNGDDPLPCEIPPHLGDRRFGGKGNRQCP